MVTLGAEARHFLSFVSARFAPSLLFNKHRRSRRKWNGKVVNIAFHRHLVSRSNGEVTPPLPYSPPWLCAQKHNWVQAQLYLWDLCSHSGNNDTMKNAVFWDITRLCGSCKHSRFGGTNRFHLQGKKFWVPFIRIEEVLHDERRRYLLATISTLSFVLPWRYAASSNIMINLPQTTTI
jgi:hypothetical protein